MEKLTGGLAKLTGGFSALMVVSKLSSVQREFDVLNASLITMTGSSAKAAQEFAWIKKFAAETPYGLNEVTQAFVKMKALGLDASEKALNSYGNTASAMGKGLNQMIEAVADAATGEFERLKEFGIKAKKEGENVSLTFQGVTTSIGNNSAEITKYLQGIGDAQFGGAMAERAKTLDGAISNLADTWDELFRTINENDAGALIYDSVKLASGAIGDAITLIKAMSSASAENARETGAMAAIQNGLAVVFETVAVLGVNLKYVLVQIGDTVGGLAAQVVAASRLDFAGVKAIQDSLIANGIAARKQVDETSERILSARKNAQALASWAATGPHQNEAPKAIAAVTAATKTNTGASKEAAAAARELAKAYSELLKSAQSLADTRNAEYNAIAAWMQAEEQARINTVKAANDSVRAAQDEYDNYGKTKSQIAEVTLARLNDKLQGVNAGTEIAASIGREIEAQEQLIGILQKGEVREAGVKAAADSAAEWQKASDQINQSLTDALFRAFESGKGFFDTLWSGIKNLFKTTVLKMMIQGVVGSVTGAMGMTAANAATGGGGIMSSLSNLSTLSTLGSAISTGIAGAVGSSVSAVFGTMAGNAAIGTTLGLGASSSVAAASAASVAGGGAAAGAGLTGATAALSAIPVWGWVAMAAIAVAGMFGGRGKKEATGGGIEGNFSGAGFAGNNFSTWKQDGGWFHNDRTGKDTSALDAATAKQFGDAYGAVRQSATQAAASLGLSADAITNYSQSVSLQLGSDAAANEKAVAAMFAGIGDGMARAAAPGIGLLAKEGEAAGQTMARLSTSITTANAWLSILRQRLFQVSMAGGDAASKLADAFGGLENLGAASKAFYETYYTEGERAERSQQDMAKALSLVNLAMPTTKDGLRELAGSLDLNTESGRKAYAMLLAIAPEFSVAADLASKFSKETADKLIKTFTGGGQLVPALNSAALQTALLGDTLVSTYEVAGNISTLFLNVNSGLLTFGARTRTLTGGLTGAQLAALQLTGQIEALHQGADRTRIDFVGLSAALEGVDTETFANTVALVFDNLATRISGVIDSIGAERIAVREAALQIVNPTVMGKDAITRAIGGINVNAPNNAALVAAQQALGRADANVGAQKSAVDYTRSLAPSRAALDAAGGTLGAAQNATRAAQARVDDYMTMEGGKFAWWTQQGLAGNNPIFRGGRPSGEKNAVDTAHSLLAARAAEQAPQAAYDAQLAAYGNAVAVNAAQIAAAQASLSAAAAAQAAAVTAARTAQTAYIASLQDFSIDASKAVGKLGKLREETVKYYEAQKQLADLMGNSAAGLRTTVADYRYSQLSDAQQFDKLQADFAKNYAMGLSTDGGTLAGYGDKLNAGLNPLLEKAREVLSGSAYDSFAATALARAEAIAGRLETLTPTDYAADSLAMLGQIDTALAALDASSKSAEKIIADAVSAGSEKTAGGLRAVISALTGQAIPAFAAGGSFSGGLRIVGENGPELEATGPSRIFNAAQTRGMLSGGGNTARLEALVERLTQEVGSLKQGIRDISATNARMADLAVRTEQDGQMVYTTAESPLATVAA